MREEFWKLLPVYAIGAGALWALFMLQGDVHQWMQATQRRLHEFIEASSSVDSAQNEHIRGLWREVDRMATRQGYSVKGECGIYPQLDGEE